MPSEHLGKVHVSRSLGQGESHSSKWVLLKHTFMGGSSLSEIHSFSLVSDAVYLSISNVTITRVVHFQEI